MGAGYSMSDERVDAAYGYSVWLRHLVSLAKHGVRGPFPTVVELGPGNSVATGVCAVLCGAERYVGLDVLRHFSPQAARAVHDDVVAMFRDRAPVPGDSVYAELHPRLDNYQFPGEALGMAALEASVDPVRIAALRHDIDSLARGGDGGSVLRYTCPWTADSVAAGGADLVITQAVLQEIPHGGRRSPLRETIRACASWLRPGGVASHQIDFGMYGLKPWNVHWAWSDLAWRLVRGKRANFVNREPLSTYMSLFEECGLKPIAAVTLRQAGVEEDRLTRRFRDLGESDRRTSAALLIMRRE